MYLYDGKVFAEDDDLCKTCQFAVSEDKLCPLMNALGTNEVCFCLGSLVIDDCDFYEKINA